MLAHKFNQIVGKFFMKQRNLIFAQKILHVLHDVLANPTLMLFAGLSNIILVLHFGCKYFVFFSFSEQFPKSSDIFFESTIIIFIFLMIFRLFFKLVYLVVFCLGLSLQCFDFGLVKLDLPLQQLFIHFLWIYWFVNIFYIFLDAGVGYFLINEFTLARCQLLFSFGNLQL